MIDRSAGPPGSHLKRRATAALANSVTRSAVARLTAGRLRILAYHGIADISLFERAVRHITDLYPTVGETEVVDALRNGASLPHRAVWFTFDDGLKSTLDASQMLARYGVKATCFVNPGTIAENVPHWFDILDQAFVHGLVAPSEKGVFSRRRLKTISDDQRRADILELAARLKAGGYSVTNQSGRKEDLVAWLEAGHSIGNHTWDHPCLDRCSTSAQTEQIERAHKWLRGAGIEPLFFAYPNGNWTAHSQRTVESLGYRGTLLFDHDLARTGRHGAALSRLRINSDADISRVDAIVSGTHSTMFQAAGAARRLISARRHGVPAAGSPLDKGR